MVRVIKLSMKCTLIGAFRGRHGRKKRKVSAEGGQGPDRAQASLTGCPEQVLQMAMVSCPQQVSSPSVCRGRAAAMLGWERGERKSSRYWGQGVGGGETLQGKNQTALL